MNNKTIIELDFRIIYRIMEIKAAEARRATPSSRVDLHNFSDNTQPHPIIVKK